MNRKFGKTDLKRITEYAPNAVIVNGAQVTNPNADQYLAADDGPWKRIEEAKPPRPAEKGRHWERIGYRETVSEIIGEWSEVENPPAPPAVYSVADLTFWAVTHGKNAALAAWLKEAGYYEVYLTTREFAADNEVFTFVKAALIAQGICTEEELAEALEYAKVGV